MGQGDADEAGRMMKMGSRRGEMKKTLKHGRWWNARTQPSGWDQGGFADGQ